MATRMLLMSAFFVCMNVGIVSAGVNPPSPRHVAQAMVQSLQASLQESGEAARETVRKAIADYLDMKTIAKRAIGDYWDKLGPERKKEYVDLFTTYVVNLAVRHAHRIRDSEIRYGEEMIGLNRRARMELKMEKKGAARFHVNEISLRMHLVKDVWKIFEVIFDGIDITRNLESQFSTIIGRLAKLEQDETAMLDTFLGELRKKAETIN